MRPLGLSEQARERLIQRVSETFRERAVFPVGLQRYWEYLWTLRNLPEGVASVVDIGCGDASLFTDILAAENYWQILACDPEALPETAHPAIRFFQAGAEEFVETIAPGQVIDAVVCVSVLEHVEDRPGFCAALDKLNCPILLTFEFCRDDSDMAHCLIPLGVLNQCLMRFERHYVSRMEQCPVYAENSRMGEWVPVAIRLDVLS
jgi:SAM-dependent methyltransferase